MLCFSILTLHVDKLFPMDYKVVSAFLELVSEKWQEIARALGLSEQTYHRIQETNGGNPELCCSQMIEECSVRSEVKFDWCSLTDALRSLSMEYLADHILLDWGKDSNVCMTPHYRNIQRMYPLLGWF